MTFASPQSWTDVDIAGIPLSWTSRDNKLLYPAYEMLRLALVERVNACRSGADENAAFYAGSIRDPVHVSVPAILGTPLSSGTFPYAGWFAAFQSTMTTLIENYVNHTANEGDWSGVTYGNIANTAPLWTEADILAAIGDLSREETTIPKASWTLQQYKLLNKLRWVRHAYYPGGGAVQSSRKGSVPSSGDWATAVANFDARSWSTYNGTPYHYAAWNAIGGTWTISRVRNIISQTERFAARAADAYIPITSWIYVPSSSPPGFSANVYENQDYPLAANGELFKVQSNAADSAAMSISIGNFAAATVSQPASTSDIKGWGMGPWYIDTTNRQLTTSSAGALLVSCIVVEKYDVVNGFKFVAP